MNERLFSSHSCQPAQGPSTEHISEGSLAIEIAHLTRKYGTLTAVEGLCLEVPRGRLFGFLGPNGAGKTTTIGCLTGQLDPSGGSICLFGERFTSASMDLKRRIGVMPEGLALFDQLYAHEFLSFIGRMYGLDKVTARRRVGELLDAMDLTSSLNRRLGDYSTGMRRKVAFAAAIIHAPEALFLDEPFAGMDVATVVMLKKWLRQFVARGRTVFLTTHVLETVERLCDDAAIINAGRLVWRGDVSNLSRGHSLQFDNRHFDTLEELFLHIVGQPLDQPDWF